mmetsp:Transcript_11372/g.34180  ORF Transcript_11372/g.34180 Transcript_11372/m.34180 type:complete len:333 (+) Transcript_11372:151-1149(+)
MQGLSASVLTHAQSPPRCAHAGAPSLRPTNSTLRAVRSDTSCGVQRSLESPTQKCNSSWRTVVSAAVPSGSHRSSGRGLPSARRAVRHCMTAYSRAGRESNSNGSCSSTSSISSGIVEDLPIGFGSEEDDSDNGDSKGKLPPYPEDVISSGPTAETTTAVKDREEDGDVLKSSDLDYLAELIAMQQETPKDIGFFGTRNMGYMHQQLIEVLSYAMVLTGNHIYTSGATGTNAAVIRGALKADRPDLLTVVLPQSLSMQPEESRDLLKEVKNVISKPEADHLTLQEASRICNKDIVSRVKQIICFAFHDSSLLLETCKDASEARRLVALFYLD